MTHARSPNSPSAASLLVAFALIALAALCASCDTEDGASDAPAALEVAFTIDPDPPVVGKNKLHITVKDADGADVAGAKVTVKLSMPAMGHGSTEDPVVSEVGGGKYDAAPITFQMAGSWLVRVDASHGGATGTASRTLAIK